MCIRVQLSLGVTSLPFPVFKMTSYRMNNTFLRDETHVKKKHWSVLKYMNIFYRNDKDFYFFLSDIEYSLISYKVDDFAPLSIF